MSVIQVCPKCNKPIMEHASTWVKQSTAVCVCGTPFEKMTVRNHMAKDAAAARERHAQPAQASERPGTRTAQERPTEGAKVDSVLEVLFMQILDEHLPHYPKPLREQELIPGRNFKTDFCWPKARVAVEIDGAVHRTKDRFYSDCDKHNLLVTEGWTYLRFNGRQLRHKVIDVVRWLEIALKGQVQR